MLRQGLYIHTAKNVLIQVNPQVRLPRTFKRFCGLMVQLLQKLSIRSSNGPDKLLKVPLNGLSSKISKVVHELRLDLMRFVFELASALIHRRCPFVLCLNAQIVKGPVTKYFPPNSRRVGFSYSSPEVVKLPDFVRDLPDDTPPVFTVGAMAHGKIDVTYNDQMISVSEYPLSAAYCISRITNAFELKWDIV